MSLAIQRAEYFELDFTNQFGWYVDEAGPEVARRFQIALDGTLQKLTRLPDLGRARRFKNPRLRGLRSIAIDHPFEKLLIFYRLNADCIEAWRLMHGSRNLPRRLVETPE